MSVPFHKQTDPNKQAGQAVLCSCKDRFKHQCPGEWEQGCDLGANEKHVVVVRQTLNDLHKQETTLAQYLKRKQEGPPRITFEEWWKEYDGGPDYSNTGIAESAAEDIWIAALTKGKL